MIVFAIRAVSSRNMLRSVIYLLFVLMGIAGIYFLVDYTFLAAVQLAVYAGGVIVLIIFSVLLVHHIELKLDEASLKSRILAFAMSVLGIGITLYTIWTYPFQAVENYNSIEVADIGRGLLSYGDGGFILPFEVISVLLIAAPATCLHACSQAKQPMMSFGAQNIHNETDGPFTGEISSLMAADAGADFVLLGHSERRQIFNETNKFINSKVFYFRYFSFPDFHFYFNFILNKLFCIKRVGV